MEQKINYSAFADLIEEVFSNESFEPVIWASKGSYGSDNEKEYTTVDFFKKNYDNVDKSMQSLCKLLRSNLPENEFHDSLLNYMNSPVWPIAEKLIYIRNQWINAWYKGRENEINYPINVSPLNPVNKEEEIKKLDKKRDAILSQSSKAVDLSREHNFNHVNSNVIMEIEEFLRASVGLEPDRFLAEVNKGKSR